MSATPQTEEAVSIANSFSFGPLYGYFALTFANAVKKDPD
tara:strand:+ start:301 stop:420 length:120 start_codon:yes stop_codon:yes gene_type:complete